MRICHRGRRSVDDGVRNGLSLRVIVGKRVSGGERAMKSSYSFHLSLRDNLHQGFRRENWDHGRMALVCTRSTPETGGDVA